MLRVLILIIFGSWISRLVSVPHKFSDKRSSLHLQVILMILAANAAVGVITETNAEKALEVYLKNLAFKINLPIMIL